MLASAVALALGACGSDDDSGSGDDQGATKVKLGLSSAFSGDLAFYGQNSKRGVEFAISELQRTRPDLAFELVTADDECTPEGGAAAYRQLAQIDQVDMIIGSTCSGSTLGGMPVLASSQLPGMTFSSANPEISAQSGVGGNAFSWRMNIDDSIMGTLFAKVIADRGAKRLAFLGVNSDYGRGAAEIYDAALPRSGVDVMSTEYFEPASGDVRAQLSKIKSQRADALLFVGTSADCAVMLRQLNELGMDLDVYSRGSCASDETLTALGDQRDLADGLLEGTYWFPSPDQADFLAGFEKRFGLVPDYNAGLGYVAVMTLAEALKGGEPDREAIQAALDQVRYESPIGPVEFDDHHQAHPDFFLVTVADGKEKFLKTVGTAGTDAGP